MLLPTQLKSPKFKSTLQTKKKKKIGKFEQDPDYKIQY